MCIYLVLHISENLVVTFQFQEFNPMFPKSNPQTGQRFLDSILKMGNDSFYSDSGNSFRIRFWKRCLVSELNFGNIAQFYG